MTSTDRTIIVSSSTPRAMVVPSCSVNVSGIVASAPKVAASTNPADVITPPVEDNAISEPFRVPWLIVSSRTRVIKKML